MESKKADRRFRMRRWPPQVPDAVKAPLTAAVLLLIVAMLGLAIDQSWLFPSLGPTAFMQAEYPDHRTSRFSNIAGGHLLGLRAAVLAVFLFGAQHTLPVAVSDQLAPARVWASALALAVTILVELLVHISHPPAAGTTLLVTLGSFQPIIHDVLQIVVRVLIVASLGEGLRRLRLGKLAQGFP